MNTVKGIIIFLIIFGLIVVIHEFGHFFIAKKAGVLVREFSVGMGPKLVSFRDQTGTAYTLRMLPLGGYVRLAGWGENSGEIDPGTPLTLLLDQNDVVQKINFSKKITLENGLPMEVEQADLEQKLTISGYLNGDDSKLVTYQVDHDAVLIEEDGTEVRIAPIDVQMQSASVPWRIATNFAGPFNNFVLGIAIFILIAFMKGGTPITNTTKIGHVEKSGIAAKAGISSGDRIDKIAGAKVSNWSEIKDQFLSNANEKVEIDLTTNDNQTKKVKLKVPKSSTSTPTSRRLGIDQPYNKSLVSGIIVGGFMQAMEMSTSILKSIVGLVTGFSLNKLGGPVAMFQMSQNVSNQGLDSVLYLMAVLSLNLGFMNLFPIPALDGGKIVLNIVEGIRGKPLSHEKEGVITLIGVGIMLLLMILVTWNDISRMFTK